MEGKFYPKEENLGKDCEYWDRQRGCRYPKAEVEGRLSCEGIIDTFCVYLVTKRIPSGMSEEQVIWLKTTPPSIERNRSIPPGETE